VELDVKQQISLHFSEAVSVKSIHCSSTAAYTGLGSGASKLAATCLPLSSPTGTLTVTTGFAISKGFVLSFQRKRNISTSKMQHPQLWEDMRSP